MASFQIDSRYFDNRKTKALQAKVGRQGPVQYLRLLGWVSEKYPKGIVPNDVEGIERAARWRGEPGAFLKAIVEEVLFEYRPETGDYMVHQWEEHQPKLAGKERRSMAGRIGANARWSKAQARGQEDLFGAPPPQSEEPVPEQPRVEGPRKKQDAEIPFAEIVEDLNLVTGRNGKWKFEDCRTTRGLIRALIREGFTVEDIRRVHRVTWAKWEGTDLADYVQPGTLYRMSKFRIYVNWMPRSAKSPQDNRDAKNLDIARKYASSGEEGRGSGADVPIDADISEDTE